MVVATIRDAVKESTKASRYSSAENRCFQCVMVSLAALQAMVLRKGNGSKRCLCSRNRSPMISLAMESKLFLYIDSLGFSDIIKETTRVERLYSLIDQAALHRDSNYRAIVFSDTIVAYHTVPNLEGGSKATEL